MICQNVKSILRAEAPLPYAAMRCAALRCAEHDGAGVLVVVLSGPNGSGGGGGAEAHPIAAGTGGNECIRGDSRAEQGGKLQAVRHEEDDDGARAHHDRVRRACAPHCGAAAAAIAVVGG